MAFTQDGPKRAYPTDGDQSGNQYRAMVLGANGLALAGLGDRIAGVLTDDPEAGATGTVQVRDIAKVRLGGAVARGDLLMVDAAGEFVLAVAGGAGTTRHIVGRAAAAGAAGGVGSAELDYLGALVA